jgi:hypothetical protein
MPPKKAGGKRKPEQPATGKQQPSKASSSKAKEKINHDEAEEAEPHEDQMQLASDAAEGGASHSNVPEQEQVYTYTSKLEDGALEEALDKAERAGYDWASDKHILPGLMVEEMNQLNDMTKPPCTSQQHYIALQGVAPLGAQDGLRFFTFIETAGPSNKLYCEQERLCLDNMETSYVAMVMVG